MTPVDESLEPCRRIAGSGGDGTLSSSTSIVTSTVASTVASTRTGSNSNSNSVIVIDASDSTDDHHGSSNSDSNNGDHDRSNNKTQPRPQNTTNNNGDNKNKSITISAAALSRTVKPALPLRYVHQTETKPAHYVFPRPDRAIAPARPGENDVRANDKDQIRDKEGKREGDKETNKETGRDRDTEKDKRQKANDRKKEKERGKNNDKQDDKGIGAAAQMKMRASKSHSPASPNLAQPAVPAAANTSHNGDARDHAADAASQVGPLNATAALASSKPLMQKGDPLSDALGRSGQAVPRNEQAKAPVGPAEPVTPSGDTKQPQHGPESFRTTTTTTAGAAGAAAAQSSAAQLYHDRHAQTQPDVSLNSNGQPVDSSSVRVEAPSLPPPMIARSGRDRDSGQAGKRAPPQHATCMANGNPLPFSQQLPPRFPANINDTGASFFTSGGLLNSQSSSPHPAFHMRAQMPPPPPPPQLPPMNAMNGHFPHMMHLGSNGFHPMAPYAGEMMLGSAMNFSGPDPRLFVGPMGDMLPPSPGKALGQTVHPGSYYPKPEVYRYYKDFGMNQVPAQQPLRPQAWASGPGEDSVGPGPQFARSTGLFAAKGSHPRLPLIQNGHPGDADDLVAYIQRQSGSRDLADCYLELRYVDDRAPPLRIPGHRLILSRNPLLASLAQQQDRGRAPPDGAPAIILLQTKNKWVESASFKRAVQRLYGLPLLPLPPKRDTARGEGPVRAVSADEQIEFALSYAAAGHLLWDGAVLGRGCEIAVGLLDWQHLEGALAFALDEWSDLAESDCRRYKYGDGSEAILDAVVTFIVHHFPDNVELMMDDEAAQPPPFARLPGVPPQLLSRGLSKAAVQMHRRGKKRKVSSIQFGDLPVEVGNESKDDEQSRAAASVNLTLSRVLLDIPFAQLKMILESSGSGNVRAWTHSEARHRLIQKAVDAREARRRHALEAIHAGKVPVAEEIRGALCSREPQALGPWTALGWEEVIVPDGNADGPSLARRWAPI